jgi:hypothetical protein
MYFASKTKDRIKNKSQPRDDYSFIDENRYNIRYP